MPDAVITGFYNRTRPIRTDKSGSFTDLVLLAMFQHQYEILTLHKETAVVSQYFENARTLINNATFKSWVGKEQRKSRSSSLIAAR